MRSPIQRRRWLAVVACAASLSTASVAAIPAVVAHADCTGAGDFGAGAGCPPPGDTSGSGSGESWPPTSVDWPPSQSSDSSDGGGGGGGGKGTATPIVLVDGQPLAPAQAAPTKDPSTSSPPTPIVPVGAPDARPTTTPTAIVVPTSSTG